VADRPVTLPRHCGSAMQQHQPILCLISSAARDETAQKMTLLQIRLI
jgi:hypothetical protein